MLSVGTIVIYLAYNHLMLLVNGSDRCNRGSQPSFKRRMCELHYFVSYSSFARESQRTRLLTANGLLER